MVEGAVSRVGLKVRVEVGVGQSFRLAAELTIPPGTTAALLGPNGAGKSTMVAAIAGLRPIDAGRIELEDVVLDDPDRGVFVPPEARGVGVVFQDYLLFSHMTVKENIAFGPRSRRAGRAEAADVAREWMGRLGLGGLADRKPRELSGGEAQRVALARVMATRPDALILDEPFAALDVETRSRLRRDLAKHLEGFDGPRLLITHDPTEAFLLADQIHIIEDGVITQTGTAAAIRLRPRTGYAAVLAGSNLVSGVAAHGVVDTGSHLLYTADGDADGPVLVTIRSSAISVHRERPGGSPRNNWRTTVDEIEHLGGRVRLRTGPPLALTVEITEDAAHDLSLGEGVAIWVAVKATEVMVE
jgi:molybdate transport system ATP-binding protein